MINVKTWVAVYNYSFENWFSSSFEGCDIFI